MSLYHLAQVNIGRLRGPLDSPGMADFAAALHTINRLAEETPGFVWRLQDESGISSSIRAFEDERMAINLTVWESAEALREYTYYSQHADFFRRRGEWFEKLETPVLALWWMAAGEQPTIDEAKARLADLAERGPTPYAFTFKAPFTVEAWLVYEAARL